MQFDSKIISLTWAVWFQAFLCQENYSTRRIIIYFVHCLARITPPLGRLAWAQPRTGKIRVEQPCNDDDNKLLNSTELNCARDSFRLTATFSRVYLRSSKISPDISQSFICVVNHEGARHCRKPLVRSVRIYQNSRAIPTKS